MEKFKMGLKKDWKETKLLFRALPALPFAVLVVALICMNILAGKTIVNESWIALDAGILVSWMSFLAGDMLVKRFGPKASIKVSLAAIACNLLGSLIFNIGAAIPGAWGDAPNPAIDSTLSGTLHALAAGTTAFIVAIIVDCFLNWAILKRFKKRTSFRAYAVASYVSTMVGQFVDNFVFAMLFLFALGYITFLGAVMMAAVGAVAELLCQIVLSPVGYKISEGWRKRGVGEEYVACVEEAQEVNKEG